MGAYILRRLAQAVGTIFGVMVLTFLLFRVVSGDIAAAFVGQKGTERAKADWEHAHGYDRPLLLNTHNRLRLIDRTKGDRPFYIEDAPHSRLVDQLGLTPADQRANVYLGRYVDDLSGESDLAALLRPRKGKAGKAEPVDLPAPGMRAELADGTTLPIDLAGVKTVGDLIKRIHATAGNSGADGKPKLQADVAEWRLADVLHSQFFDHLANSVTFRGRSLETNEKLTEIIAQRAPKSLALTVPAMAIGWLTAMIVSSFVAYYRGTVIDRLGVFLSVLGMCVPFLAYMILGQWLMFQIAPARAYGVAIPTNIYVPILIMVVAGLGASVRFYRTVILDEIGRDYVRTARAKGAPLSAVLFKHVLKNCMLPILTNLILAIPFLIMGSLVVETYFGIPGLGDTLLTAINKRDEPIMSGMVFLTALIYTLGLLLTDISYALFDPRVRLK